ncbi:MAG: DUF1592 domain-containing protein [Isosphaeraceae bacterium]|nr:DUF1592 domain-containing protein [Isosphaeraceae bacterium]
MRTAAVVSMLAVALMVASRPAAGADAAPEKQLEQAYQPEIRLLVERYCTKCHSPKRTEADVDLTEFVSWADVRKQPETWQKVGEMLDSGQMPPKDAKQPGAEERTRLQQWVRSYLTLEAQARAGDPGRVVLRRLSNAEYTYTLRDLTGIGSLDPAREFPVDGAAGEGFTNTGNALVMSPALITKYLDAAKGVADHAVLLPDGFRFSPGTTRRDWTDEVLARIRGFYREFTDPTGGEKVNLQGIVFETNEGGRLPVEKYLAATLAARAALANGTKTIDAVAAERGLNAKYLGTLWTSLNRSEPSLLLDGLRARWRTAKPDDAAPLAAGVAAWQKGLWRFTSVGQIGKIGGPKAWLEPVDPVVANQELRIKVPPQPDGNDVTISLIASDAGDGSERDFVVWQQPRLAAPGRADLLLRDVRAVSRDLASHRERIFASAAAYLTAAAEIAETQGKADAREMAKKHGVETDALHAWLDYLGIGFGGKVALGSHFTTKITGAGGYDFINGWGSNDTPLLLANSSGQHVRVPGNMKPHGVAVHPSPTLKAAVGWRSPVATSLRIEAAVSHAHPECGNGVTWSLELRRGATRQRLATGIAQGNGVAKAGPIEHVAVQPGDVVSLLIGPRDGNHACDLTAVDLKLTSTRDDKTWDLAGDVSGDILAGNPHADRLGNAGVWHFYTEPDKGGSDAGAVIPAGSLLAKWQTAQTADEKRALAVDIQKLLTAAPPTAKDNPDTLLYRELASLGGPLFRGTLTKPAAERTNAALPGSDSPAKAPIEWGLDPATFGKRPDGSAIDAASLCVRAPSVIEIHLPADLVAGCELITTAALDPQAGKEGSVQVQMQTGKPGAPPALQPGQPILANPGSHARERIESAFGDFRRLFPAALCYSKIVPVDEVITLTLFYREDDQLARLMLDDAQKATLDRLWDELRYVSQDALTLVDAFAQLLEYASQDADPKVFEPLRKPINDRAAAFRKRLVDTEPKHLDSLLEFAARAYRRPLTAEEGQELRSLYSTLRKEEIPHDDAIRLTLARVLVAPAFLYRVEKPGPGAGQGPVSDVELATRLSYFLWSSQPDDELRQVAASGRLHDPQVLVAQMRRMLHDAKTRRLATEFACQWLHIHDFDHLDEKSDRHFPTFIGLRGAMYEESIRFFTDLFQNNGSVLGILDSDSTFLNEDLAKHYGIPGVTGPDWRRVEGIKKHARGGILGQATTLSKQSGASRTSPILRGNWISEVLLGERLPRPPKGVPVLPDDEAALQGQTVRQLVEKHSTDPKCYVCHRRIDPFGYALEGFDAIGRFREKDLGDRPIDTHAKTLDGASFEGLGGLRTYLLTVRRDAFLRQFCRKLLGYSLGRAVQLSDEPLLAELQTVLKSNDYKVVPVVEAIVRSRQFREIRGRESAYND